MSRSVLQSGSTLTAPSTGAITDAQLPVTAQAATLSATFVPKWKPTTAYTLGQQVTSPNGDVVSAIAAHTSGASFTPANWSYSPTYATPAALATNQQRGLTPVKVGTVLSVGTAAFENWVVESANVVFDPITQQYLMVYVAYSTFPVPTGVSVSSAITGGTIAASQQRFYKVAAIPSSGEIGVVSTEVNVTAGSGTATNANTVTWSAIAGATYRVYVGAAAGAENTYFNVSGTSFTDTGAAGTAGSPTSSGAPGNASVGLATSLDGIKWTRTGTAVIQGTGVGGDPDQYGTSGPSLWIENDTYNLFYISLDNSGYEGGTKRMCLATATNINGPWTRKGAIITPGGGGWRNVAIYHRSIVKQPNGTYYMFFNAMGADGKEQIGLATATSITGPWTVDDTNSPVLAVGGAGSWDSVNVGDPCMYRVGDTWYMAYYGYNSTAAQDGVAFTTASAFPYGWTKHSANPVLKIGATGALDDIYAHKPFILPTPGGLFHYYTAVGTGQPSIALKSIALAIDAPGAAIAAKLNPQPIVDTFTRANSTAGLGTTTTGQVWSNDLGVAQILSNSAAVYTMTNNEAVMSIDSGVTDGKASIRLVAAVPQYTAVGLICRMLDAQNFIYVDIGQTAIGLTKRSKGADAVILTPVTRTIAAGDVITVSSNFNSITVWHNGVWLGTVQTSFAITGTRRGLRFYGNSGGGATADDFTVTAF